MEKRITNFLAGLAEVQLSTVTGCFSANYNCCEYIVAEVARLGS